MNEFALMSTKKFELISIRQEIFSRPNDADTIRVRNEHPEKNKHIAFARKDVLLKNFVEAPSEVAEPFRILSFCSHLRNP